MEIIDNNSHVQVAYVCAVCCMEEEMVIQAVPRIIDGWMMMIDGEIFIVIMVLFATQ